MLRTGLFREQPLQLLTRTNEGLILNSQALELICEIKSPLAVIAVVGPPRSGKSYLLNNMLLSKKHGFSVGEKGHQRGGLTIWGKPLLGQNAKLETISILLVDTNTSGFTDIDERLLVALSTVMSSTVLFNCPSSLKESTVELQGVLTQNLNFEGFETNTSLYCILRDSKSNSQLAQECSTVLNRTQASPIFRQHNVITLNKPVANDSLLETLEDVDYDQLSPDFVEQLIQVRRKITTNLSAKTINGKVLDGANWVQMLRVCVTQINARRTLSSLRISWERFCEAECAQAVADCLELYRHKYREITLSKRPVSQDILESAHCFAKQAAMEVLEKRCPSRELVSTWKDALDKILKEELNHVILQNTNENFETTNEFLTFEYQTIERKLKTRELRTVEDYRKEMSMFHEFYKRKGNNSIVGRDCYYEFVLKKLYDGVTTILNYTHEESQEKIRVLTEAAKRMEAEIKESKQSAYKDKNQVQTKIEKLTQQNNELAIKEQALEEAIEDMKLQKEAHEKSHLLELAKERSEHARTVQELRSRMSQLESKAQESERSRMMLESQLHKKDVLYSKSLQNYENIIGEHKAALGRFAADKETILTKAEAERRAVEMKFQGKLRQYQSQIKQQAAKLQQAEEKVEMLSGQLLETKEQNQMKTLESKEAVQSLQNLKKELELECKIYEKKINENKHKAERLNRQEEELRVLSEELQRLNEELKLERADKQKIKAVLEQQKEFLELELKDERSRSHVLEERVRETSSTLQEKSSLLDNRSLQFQEELIELRRLVVHLQEEGARKSSQLKILKERLEDKDQELFNYLKISKEREEALEASKSALLDQMRNSDVERTKLARLNDSRKNEEVEKLKEQIQTIKEAYKEQLQELKNSSEQSLQQLKNFHALEKQRLECRLMEERSRNEKKSQTSETETLRRLREAGHRHQQDLLELKRQLWEDEKNYKSEINRLEYLLSEQKAENEQLRNRQPVVTGSDESQLQIQIMSHRMQDIAQENNNRLQEIKAITTQKDKLEELLRIREESYKLAKESQESQLMNSKARLEELTAKHQLQARKAQDLADELAQLKQSAALKHQSLLVENRFLTDKVSFITKQHDQVRNSHEQEMARLKRQHTQSLRDKLLQAERELDSIQDKYEQARECILEMEQAHARELSRAEQDRRLLQSQLNTVGSTNNLLFRKLRTP